MPNSRRNENTKNAMPARLSGTSGHGIYPLDFLKTLYYFVLDGSGEISSLPTNAKLDIMMP